MPELLEFLLNAVLELLSCISDDCVGLRFLVCFFVSIVIAMLLEWLLPKGDAADVASAVVTCAGAIGGFIWETRSKDLG